ncbi:MAG: hypothetical protein ACXAB4_11280 [Candidatus Hodarchaeales archaeon]|jgi:hypothetical protein
MSFLDETYPGQGLLTKLAICTLITSLAFAGIFWANSERLIFLEDYHELVNDPDYPNPLIQDRVREKQQMADFYTTLTVFFFLVALAAIGTACYFALKLYSLQAWKAEWERVRYYLNLLFIWAIAVISIIGMLLLLGWLFEN